MYKTKNEEIIDIFVKLWAVKYKADVSAGSTSVA
jgi:hypothetical protein